MPQDETGLYLTPGNSGKDCKGNGCFLDEKGNPILCRCNECDYGLCCSGFHNPEACCYCITTDCPHNKTTKNTLFSFFCKNPPI